MSGKSSTGSGSGYPGIGAIRTKSPAETYCKDGKVRRATASKLYRLDVSLSAVNKKDAMGTTHFVTEAFLPKYSDTPAAVLQGEEG